MRKMLLFALFVTLPLFAGTKKEGVINSNIFNNTGYSAESAENAARSSADWFDAKMLTGDIDTNSVITVASYWGTTIPLLCKAVYNASGTATVIKMATTNTSAPGATDTLRLALDAYGCSPKLPALAKIFKLAETDSLIVFFQVYY